MPTNWNYANAVWPESLYKEFRILGIRLKPISIAHLLLLEHFHSPFITGEFSKDPKTSQAHLLFAALVCSMTDIEFIQFFKQDDYQQQILNYGIALQAKNPADFDEMGLLKGELFESEFNRLHKYINDAVPLIPYKSNIEDDSDTELAYHGLQNLLLSALKCGYSDNEALNLPVSRIRMDVYKSIQDTGAISIITDKDEQDRIDNWEKYITVIKKEETAHV